MLKMQFTYKKVYVKFVYIKNYMYLCSVIIKKMCNPLNSVEMNEDLEERIERQKKKISDYLRIAPVIGISKEDMERQTDLMLKDLSKLMKQREK